MKKGSSDPLPNAPSVADVTGMVAAEVNLVRASATDILARARVVALLAGVLIKAIEVGSIEERLEALEEKIGGKDGGK